MLVLFWQLRCLLPCWQKCEKSKAIENDLGKSAKSQQPAKLQDDEKHTRTLTNKHFHEIDETKPLSGNYTLEREGKNEMKDYWDTQRKTCEWIQRWNHLKSRFTCDFHLISCRWARWYFFLSAIHLSSHFFPTLFRFCFFFHRIPNMISKYITSPFHLNSDKRNSSINFWNVQEIREWEKKKNHHVCT